MLVEIVKGNYHWNLEHDVCGFWNRFLDNMATVPRDTLPRDLMRRTFKEARDCDADFSALIENRINLFS